MSALTSCLLECGGFAIWFRAEGAAMCGILGTCDLSTSAGQLAAMSAAIAHRGPDADGTWSSSDEARRVQLGHRRLSIIDLSAAANQPFVKDGLVLVFC